MRNSAKNFSRLCIALIITALLLCSISSICFADNGDTIVYVTNSGYAYHIGSCYHLRSKNAITLRQATIDGYHPCKDCQPPIFNGVLPVETQPPKPITSGSGSGGIVGGGVLSGSGTGGGTYTGSGSNSGSSSSHTTAKTEASIETTSTTKPVQTKKASEKRAIITILIVIGSVFVLLFIAVFEKTILDNKRSRIKDLKRKNNLYERTKAQKGILVQRLNELNERLKKLSEAQSGLQEIIETKTSTAKKNLEDFLIKYMAEMSYDGLPKIYDGVYPYGADCTVFFYKRSKVYHKTGCRCLKTDGYISTHILKVPKDKLPCKYCKPNRNDTKWMKEGVILWKTNQTAQEASSLYGMYYSIQNNLDRTKKIEHMLKILSGEVCFSNEMIDPMYHLQRIPLKYRIIDAPHRIKSVLSKKVNVHVLETQIEEALSHWGIDFDTGKVNKCIYAEVWVVGLNLTREDYRQWYDKKTKSLYVVLSKRRVGITRRIFVSKEKWESEVASFRRLRKTQNAGSNEQ